MIEKICLLFVLLSFRNLFSFAFVYISFLFSDPSKKPDAFYTREREITEIEGIIPEIREKIADTKDMQEETIKKIGDKRLLEDAFAAAAAKATEEEAPKTGNSRENSNYEKVCCWFQNFGEKIQTSFFFYSR